ncbi:MAG TPA: CapA family protein [Chthoniobacteraceae bacterium]|nr:CapA family protein [Chthoniobacteraceae bacterium]
MISFAATGDSFITRRLPDGDPDAEALAALIGRADFRFTNLETTLRRDEGFPSAQSGGTWSSAAPEVLEDLRRYGFNVAAWANNHTLDYSYGALHSTAEALDRYGFLHAGAGRHLAEAGAIRYLETPGGRVALIAATSTFHESWAAGAQRGDVQGRPGVNPLRFTTRYHVSREELDALRKIAETSQINAVHKLRVKEGFALPDAEGVVRLGNDLFCPTENGVSGAVTAPHQGDLKRLLASVGEAKRQANQVIVSIHAHEMKGEAKDEPADFLQTFSRACIDHGAHAVIGHGPHLLRGVEIHAGCPIFYSLGNFIFQSETVAALPADFYAQYGLSAEENTADALDARSKGDTRGFVTNPKIWASVVACWEMEGRELKKLEFHPVSLGFGQPRFTRGWPRLTNDTTILEELRALSLPMGTDLKIENGVARLR